MLVVRIVESPISTTSTITLSERQCVLWYYKAITTRSTISKKLCYCTIVTTSIIIDSEFITILLQLLLQAEYVILAVLFCNHCTNTTSGSQYYHKTNKTSIDIDWWCNWTVISTRAWFCYWAVLLSYPCNKQNIQLTLPYYSHHNNRDIG